MTVFFKTEYILLLYYINLMELFDSGHRSIYRAAIKKHTHVTSDTVGFVRL